MIGKMGTDSLTRRVRRRAPGDISRDLGNQVETMLEGFDIDSVGKLSKCAGAFFAWVSKNPHKINCKRVMCDYIFFIIKFSY